MESRGAASESQPEMSAIPIKITHGYSRDHRPDLKQFILDLDEEQKATKKLAQLCVQEFSSYQIAEDAADQFQQSLKYHQLTEIKITAIKIPADSPHKKPNQPETNSGNTYKLTGDLNPNETEVNAGKNRAGRFVLATNRLSTEQFTADDILRKYKDRQAPERGFAFLKDPLFLVESHLASHLSRYTSSVLG